MAFRIYCLYLLSNATFNETMLALLLLRLKTGKRILFYEVCLKNQKHTTTVWGGFVLFCFVGGYQVSSRTGRWYPRNYYKTSYWESWIQTESRSARQSNYSRKVRGAEYWMCCFSGFFDPFPALLLSSLCMLLNWSGRFLLL